MYMYEGMEGQREVIEGGRERKVMEGGSRGRE